MSEWTASEPVEVALAGRRWRAEINDGAGRVAYVYGHQRGKTLALAKQFAALGSNPPPHITRAAVHRAVRDVLQSKQGQEYSHPSTKFSERIELLREICDWVADELLGKDGVPR